jgi:uncharacterized protein
MKVLDSWAILAFLEDEPSAPEIEKILIDAARAQEPLWMTAVNLGEVWYSIARTRSKKEADEVIRKTMSLNVKIVPADWDLSYQAAKFKVQGQIAYADCFAAALALSKRAELVTGDPEFKRLEGQIKIVWV